MSPPYVVQVPPLSCPARGGGGARRADRADLPDVQGDSERVQPGSLYHPLHTGTTGTAREEEEEEGSLTHTHTLKFTETHTHTPNPL